MRINFTLLVILFIAAVNPSLVTADSEEVVTGIKNGGVSVDGREDRANETADLTKTGNGVNLDNNVSTEQLDHKEKENEERKGNGGDQRVEGKEKEGSSSEAINEAKKGRLAPVREKCDSSSNHCMDADKTLVACLRVPGNESPSLSLLIQNKAKGPLSITISAPDSVQLERKEMELQENKDTEVKVSLGNVENGHFIVLTAGHGNCTLDIKEEFAGTKMDDHTPVSSNLTISRLSLPRGVVIFGGLVIVGVSFFMCRKSGSKYFARKNTKYQRLDMELPVSNPVEGWDNSWEDTWDDEEAPVMTSLPLTPTFKFKEGWKD